jgi:hypothetical protein
MTTVEPVDHTRDRGVSTTRRRYTLLVKGPEKEHPVEESKNPVLNWIISNIKHEYAIVCLIFCTFGFLAYLGVSIRDIIYATNNPTTALSFETKTNQIMPTVTVCNWNSVYGDCSYVSYLAYY